MIPYRAGYVFGWWRRHVDWRDSGKEWGIWEGGIVRNSFGVQGLSVDGFKGELLWRCARSDRRLLGAKSEVK